MHNLTVVWENEAYFKEPADFAERMDRLVTWVVDDFNVDHKDGVDQTRINQSLKFIIGLFRLAYMKPWQWVGYIYSLVGDYTFFAPNSKVLDEL